LPARSHPAYRLLTEYFCFPEKFNFFDIDLALLAASLPAGDEVADPAPGPVRPARGLEHGAHAGDPVDQ
jgi:hypothetical protein